MSRARSLANLANSGVFSADASTSRVGINSSAPERTLDIVGDGRVSGTLSIGGTINYEDVTSIDSIGVVTARDGVHIVSAGASIYSPANNELALYTNSSEKVRIDSSSTISIGNLVSPASANIHLDLYCNSSYDGFIRFRDESGAPGLIGFDHGSNAMQFYTNGASPAMSIDSSGRIGLGTGTVSPSKKLELNYVESANHNSSVGSYEVLIWNKASSSSYPSLSAGIQLRAGGSNAGAGSIHGVRRGPSNQGDLAFATTDAVGSNVEQVRIDSAGRMGIGNSNPSALGTGRLVVGDGSASSEIITVFSSTSGTGNIHFADGTTGSDRYRGYISYLHTDNSMSFGTNDVEQMRITSGGQLNIGGNFTQTDYTAQVTRIGGNTDVMQLKGNVGNAFIRFTDNDASSDFTFGADDSPGTNTNNLVVYDRNASAYRLCLNGSGHFGIGTQDPQALLQLGSRTSSSPQGNLHIARGEAISGGSGPSLSLIHGPDGGTQRSHQIYSFIGDLRIFADAAENLELSGSTTIFKDSSRTARFYQSAGIFYGLNNGDYFLSKPHYVNSFTLTGMTVTAGTLFNIIPAATLYGGLYIVACTYVQNGGPYHHKAAATFYVSSKNSASPNSNFTEGGIQHSHVGGSYFMEFQESPATGHQIAGVNVKFSYGLSASAGTLYGYAYRIGH